MFLPQMPPLVARLFQWQYLTFPKTSSYSLQFPLNNYEKRRSKRFTCCERALFQSNCSSTRTRCIFVAHTVLVFHALLHLWNLPWKKVVCFLELEGVERNVLLNLFQLEQNFLCKLLWRLCFVIDN